MTLKPRARVQPRARYHATRTDLPNRTGLQKLSLSSTSIFSPTLNGRSWTPGSDLSKLNQHLDTGQYDVLDISCNHCTFDDRSEPQVLCRSKTLSAIYHSSPILKCLCPECKGCVTARPHPRQTCCDTTITRSHQVPVIMTSSSFGTRIAGPVDRDRGCVIWFCYVITSPVLLELMRMCYTYIYAQVDQAPRCIATSATWWLCLHNRPRPLHLTAVNKPTPNVCYKNIPTLSALIDGCFYASTPHHMDKSAKSLPAGREFSSQNPWIV